MFTACRAWAGSLSAKRNRGLGGVAILEILVNETLASQREGGASDMVGLRIPAGPILRAIRARSYFRRYEWRYFSLSPRKSGL